MVKISTPLRRQTEEAVNPSMMGSLTGYLSSSPQRNPQGLCVRDSEGRWLRGPFPWRAAVGLLQERPGHGLLASWSQLRAWALDTGLVMLLLTFF